jgi:hypothetical protein
VLPPRRLSCHNCIPEGSNGSYYFEPQPNRAVMLKTGGKCCSLLLSRLPLFTSWIPLSCNRVSSRILFLEITPAIWGPWVTLFGPVWTLILKRRITRDQPIDPATNGGLYHSLCNRDRHEPHVYRSNNAGIQVHVMSFIPSQS